MFLLVMNGGGKEMMNKQIGTIAPFFFEDRLLIALSKDWINVFEKLPNFEIKIDSSNRLNITSKDRIKKQKEKKRVS